MTWKWKCSKCGAKVEHLNNYQGTESKYRFTGDRDGYIHRFEYDRDYLTVDEYECPRCHHKIAKNLAEAIQKARKQEGF